MLPSPTCGPPSRLMRGESMKATMCSRHGKSWCESSASLVVSPVSPEHYVVKERVLMKKMRGDGVEKEGVGNIAVEERLYEKRD